MVIFTANQKNNSSVLAPVVENLTNFHFVASVLHTSY